MKAVPLHSSVQSPSLAHVSALDSRPCRLSRSEWHHVTARQSPHHSSHRPRPGEHPSGRSAPLSRQETSERLREKCASIAETLKKVSALRDANAASSTPTEPQTEDLPEVNRKVSDYLSRHTPRSFPDIDLIISHVEKSVDAIAKSNWRANTSNENHRIAGAFVKLGHWVQNALPDVRKSKLNAEATNSVLEHTQVAVDGLLKMLEKEAEAANFDIRQASSDVDGRYTERANTLNACGPTIARLRDVVLDELDAAKRVIPKEKRLRRTKVIIILALAVTAAAFGIAAIFAPPLAVPALKLIAAAVSLTAAGNVAYGHFAYSRPTSVRRLSESLSELSQLLDLTSREIRMRQDDRNLHRAACVVHSATENERLAEKVSDNVAALNIQLEDLRGRSTEIARRNERHANGGKVGVRDHLQQLSWQEMRTMEFESESGSAANDDTLSETEQCTRL